MKTDCYLLGWIRNFGVLLLLPLALTACGPQRTADSAFSGASDQCLSDAAQNKFLVRYFDGRVEVVKAESKQAFIRGFLTRNLDRIEYAEHDFYVHSIAEQMGVTPKASSSADNWGAMRIDVESMWQQNVRGEGITVAVVDSGMDINHPQLRNQILVNDGEKGNDSGGHSKASNGIDDDGNGFVDDTFGYDFSRNEGLKGDNLHHGTHVSGIIVAEHADLIAGTKSYVQGMAPKAKVLPLAFLGEDGSGLISDGVRAINYAVARGARVINASWGGSECSRTLRDTIRTLETKNVIFVAAAGNDSSNVDKFKEYPASLNLPAQITVGATGEFDNMADYSNYGAKAVHIFAPGTSIVSTLPSNHIGSLTGTSMATPFVAGAVALLLSAVPDAQMSHIRQAIYATSVKNTNYVNASQGRLDMTGILAELHRLAGH